MPHGQWLSQWHWLGERLGLLAATVLHASRWWLLHPLRWLLHVLCRLHGLPLRLLHVILHLPRVQPLLLLLLKVGLLVEPCLLVSRRQLQRRV